MSEGRQTAGRAPAGRPERPPLAGERAGPLPDRPPMGDGHRVPHPPDLRTSAARRGLTVAGPPVRSDQPEPAAPVTGRPAGRRRRVLGGLALVVASVLATLAVVALRDGTDEPPDEAEAADSPPEEAPPPAQPSQPPPEPEVEPAPEEEPPAEWQPEILDLVQFVERERELTFEHPVRVDLLSEEDYVEEVGGEDGTLGFYDGQRVTVRGTELTPDLRGTLVHELTHALDDQRFGLFGGPGGMSPEEQAAYMGLVEGDAVRMEWAYDLTLIDGGADPADVLDEANTGVGLPGAPAPPPAANSGPGSGSGSGGGSSGSGGGQTPNSGSGSGPGSGSGSTTTTVGSSGHHRGLGQAPAPPQAGGPGEAYGAAIPSLTEALDQSPYFIGKQLIDALVGAGGNARVDQAFEDPPTTTEQVLDPRAYLAGDERLPVRGRTAEMPKGTFENQTSLGALNLYLVLAAGIDPVTALDAATGWGGESALAYTDPDGRQCIDLAAIGDTDEDTAEIGEAFADWAESGLAAHASASLRRDGAQVLTACEMGPGATDPFDALILAEARGAQAWVAMRDGGREPDAAFAFGDCVVHAAPLGTLLAPVASGGLSSQARNELEGAVASC